MCILQKLFEKFVKMCSCLQKFKCIVMYFGYMQIGTYPYRYYSIDIIENDSFIFVKNNCMDLIFLYRYFLYTMLFTLTYSQV